MKRAFPLTLCVAVLLLSCAAAVAEEILVQPGEGALAAAVVRVKAGDVLRLEPGEYRQAIRLPGGIILRGAGAERTTLVCAEYAAITITGPRVQIEGLGLRADKDARRGISSDHAVRIVGCRFERFPEAVNLRAAPLSDVLYCEFVDCDMGVRAYGKACPTIWACTFRGGRIGAFAMEGAPYVRNNLFHKTATGLLLLSEETAIVRNNVFWECSTAGVEVKERGRLQMPPSMRNNIFAQCAAAATGPATLLAGVSHCVVFGCSDKPFRDTKGEPGIDVAGRSILDSDPGLAVDAAGRVSIGGLERLRGQGLRLAHEEPPAAGDIGWSGAEPACTVPAGETLPAVRWTDGALTANAVCEEYAHLAAEGLRHTGQSLAGEGSRHFDVFDLAPGGPAAKLRFDITRFFGESGLGLR